MKQSTSDQLLTVSQAADLLDVSVNTLRNWDRQGKLKSRRTPGGQRRYEIKQLKDLNLKKIKYAVSEQKYNDAGIKQIVFGATIALAAIIIWQRVEAPGSAEIMKISENSLLNLTEAVTLSETPTNISAIDRQLLQKNLTGQLANLELNPGYAPPVLGKTVYLPVEPAEIQTTAAQANDNGELKLGPEIYAGTAIVPKNMSKVEVWLDDGKALEKTPIVTLTPTTEVATEWWLSKISAQAFTINLNAAAKTDLEFNWIAVIGN